MLNFKSLVNESFYLAQNSDVANAVSSGIIQSGLDHFQKFGQFEGRNFSASFDTSYYLQQNQDVAAAVKSGQITAVGHFLQFGQIEGRNPNIFFDTSYYLQQNQDVAAAVKSGQITVVEHFLQFGQIEGRNPGKFFDTSYYLQQNQDVAAAVKSGQITAVEHFLQFGEKEGRNPIASYDNKQYLKRYSDVADAVVKGQLFSAYRHFVIYGESVENRFGMNVAPMAMNDTNSTIEGTAINISILANDTDLNKDTLSITSFTQATQGVVVNNNDGTFTYTPKSDFTGSDSFNYTISDSYNGTATGKVNLNVVQKPSVTLALTSNSVLENSGTGLAYTFTRSNVTDNALTVNFNVTGDGVFAGTGADYTQLGAATFASFSSSSSGTAGTTVPGTGTVMFKPGEATAIVTLNPVGDTLLESDETVGLTLATGTNYTVGTATAITSTIKNDDTSVTLALASNNVLENSTTGLAYTFTRAGVTDNALTVNFNIGGDALFGEVIETDYTQLGAASFASGLGTVMFGVGETTKTVTLTPAADNVVEANETVALTLTDGAGYTAGTTTALTGTIKNDDTSVMLAVAPDGVREDSNAGLVYTFTRTGVTDNALTVNFGVEGTATFGTTGTDYSQSGPTSFNATSGTLTFAANQTTKTVTLTPRVDNVVELDEAIALTLRAGNNYTLGTTTPVIGTIMNDDTSVTVAVAPDGVTEDSGTGLVYTFTRTGAIDNDLTVNFNVGGNAVFDSDYDLSGAASFGVTNGTVMFNAGESTATVTVTPIADMDVETNEAVTLSLGSGTGYNVDNTTTAIGTIRNDDTLVTLANTTPNAADENSGTGLSYIFTRTGVTDNELTVNFNVGGTASAADDYTQLGAASFASGIGTVTFNPGDTTKTVRLTPVGDNAVESDEAIALTLATGTGYNVGTTTPVTSTIKNDDTSVTLAVSPSNVLENSNAGLDYTFTRTGVTNNALTVNFNVGGDAVLTTDYTQSGAASFASGVGTVTFAANEMTKTVRLTPVGDNVVELDEAIALTLATGTGYNVGTTTPVTSTIKNDDTSVSLAVTPNNRVDENSGNSLFYTFTRTGVTDNQLTVNFNVGGTASATDDYTQSGAASFASGVGTVTFAANEITKTVTLTPVGDNVVESDETVNLTLTTGAGYNVGTITPVTSTITNDDQLVSITALTANAAEQGSNGTYRISRSSINTTGNLSVNLAIDNTGTHLATSSDYTLSSGNTSLTGSNLTVTILDGQSYVDVTLAAFDDVQAEANETLKLNLATSNAYTIDSTQNNATVTIAANDTVVTNINDSTSAYQEGSLRQALLNAIAFAGPNTISFQLPTTPQTITLAAALPIIMGANANNTTIDGGNAANLTVSGNNRYGVFDVNGVTANFNNLTIANGNAFSGAGINQNGGTVNVSSSIFSSNLATSYGAGIASSEGILNVSNSTFSGNSNTNTTFGSAIDLLSTTATVTNSTFTNNTGGAGAILNFDNTSALTITGSTFTNNSPANVSGNYTNGGGNTPNPPA